MALSPEKNDIDITALFEYRKPITLYGKGKKELTLYMRVVGDSEMQISRVKALRASRELRDKLRDKTSDEYLAFIPDISEAEKEKIVEMLLLTSLKDISMKVAKEIEIPFPEELDSDATLEEQEEYQKQIDAYPKEREATIKREIVKRATETKEEYLEKDKKTLLKDYEKSLKNELCEIEMNRVFYDYVVYFSLYLNKDYSKSAFKSFAEFEKLPNDVKAELLQSYRNLELGMDELKK